MIVGELKKILEQVEDNVPIALCLGIDFRFTDIHGRNKTEIYTKKYDGNKTLIIGVDVKADPGWAYKTSGDKKILK